MSNKELCLEYFQLYANKNIAGISEMFSEDIVLRDWKIMVSGKQLALAETKKNFGSVQVIEIQPIYVHESDDTVIAELKIIIDDKEELFVADIITFNSAGKISSIRAYLGRGDN